MILPIIEDTFLDFPPETSGSGACLLGALRSGNVAGDVLFLHESSKQGNIE